MPGASGLLVRLASRKPAQEPLDLAVQVLAHGLLQTPGVQALQQVRLKSNLLAIDRDGREAPYSSDQLVAVVNVPASQPRQLLDLGLVDEDRLQLRLLGWSSHLAPAFILTQAPYGPRNHAPEGEIQIFTRYCSQPAASNSATICSTDTCSVVVMPCTRNEDQTPDR